MDYGEIIVAVQHVVSRAGSLRLVNCVGEGPRLGAVLGLAAVVCVCSTRGRACAVAGAAGSGRQSLCARHHPQTPAKQDALELLEQNVTVPQATALLCQLALDCIGA